MVSSFENWNKVISVQSCGGEAETGFHATVSCPVARGLRMTMKEHWDMPDEENIT
jgi:hypothetical protein